MNKILTLLREDRHWIEYPFGTLFYRILVRKLRNLNIHPNLYTITFIILGLFSGVVLAKNFVILSYILWRMSIILDLVDGPIARYKNKTSKFGQYLDNIGHIFCVLSLTIGGCYGAFLNSERHMFALLGACMVLMVYTFKYMDYAVFGERKKLRISSNGTILFIEKRISDFLDIEIVFLFVFAPRLGMLIFVLAKVLRVLVIIYKSIKKSNVK